MQKKRTHFGAHALEWWRWCEINSQSPLLNEIADTYSYKEFSGCQRECSRCFIFSKYSWGFAADKCQQTSCIKPGRTIRLSLRPVLWEQMKHIMQGNSIRISFWAHFETKNLGGAAHVPPDIKVHTVCHKNEYTPHISTEVSLFIRQ